MGIPTHRTENIFPGLFSKYPLLVGLLLYLCHYYWRREMPICPTFCHWEGPGAMGFRWLSAVGWSIGRHKSWSVFCCWMENQEIPIHCLCRQRIRLLLAGVLQGIVWLTQILLLAHWPAPADSGRIGIWGAWLSLPGICCCYRYRQVRPLLPLGMGLSFSWNFGQKECSVFS